MKQPKDWVSSISLLQERYFWVKPYENYLKQTLSGEGMVGENNYLLLWEKSEIEELNNMYETHKFVQSLKNKWWKATPKAVKRWSGYPDRLFAWWEENNGNGILSELLYFDRKIYIIWLKVRKAKKNIIKRKNVS